MKGICKNCKHGTVLGSCAFVECDKHHRVEFSSHSCNGFEYKKDSYGI